MSTEITAEFKEGAARLEQRGKRFGELVAAKRAELKAANPTLDEVGLNAQAEAAAGEELAREK